MSVVISSGARLRWLGMMLLLTGVTLAVAACGGDGGSGNPDDPAEEPLTQSGVLAPLELGDLTPAFERINFYHDIPGLLRDLSNADLAALGNRAAEAGRSSGQGFLNRETGELLFVVTIALNAQADAPAAVRYLAVQPIETILQFISPDETLFEQDRLPDPFVGEASVRYVLRYGAEEGGERLRDVASDLVVFASSGSVVFVLRSINTKGENGGGGASVDIADLSRVLSDRLREVFVAEESERLLPS